MRRRDRRGRSRRSGPHRDQRGFVAGSDGLVFGVLILVAGALLLVNLWAVVDTRMALDSAAREYLRAYTEANSWSEAAAAGATAARDVLDARGTAWSRTTITAIPSEASFGPCQTATVSMSVAVPAVRAPFLASLGTRDVSVTATELVDAHREMARGDSYDPAATRCAA